jgi:predicted dehydrogenase
MALRVASIGCGDIAQRKHFPQLAEIPGVELAAIAARDPSRLAACAARFNVPRTFTDPAAMLADPSIDAVMVLTPPDTHGRYAEMAIRAGKHVLIEKPLVPTLAEAERLTAALRQAPRPLTVLALPHLATPELALVERLLRAGAIGEVTAVESHRGHRGPTHAGWFYRKALAGGGVLFDLGIYQLSITAALFGPAVEMTALCTTRFATRTLDDGSTVEPDVEDSALVCLTLADGTAVTVNANWNGSPSHHHTRGRTIVTGRSGMLHFGVADGGIYIFRPDGDYAGLPASTTAEFDGHPCRRIAPSGTAPTIVGDFIARIRAGDTASRSLDIQAHVLEIIARAYAAPSPARLSTRIPIAKA